MPLDEVWLPDNSGDDSPPRLWQPPDPACGRAWESLAQILIQYREWVDQQEADANRELESLGHISAAGLRQLLGVAYRTSFMSDEGRPVRLRMLVRRWQNRFKPKPHEVATMRLAGRIFAVASEAIWKLREDESLVCKFAPGQVPMTEKSLAKLSPTLRLDDATLIVSEAGGLHVVGVALLGYDMDGRRVIDPVGLGRSDSGLTIEILGPGHLRVAEGNGEYTLHADEIVQRSPATHLPPVRSWLCELSRGMYARCQSELGVGNHALNKVYEACPAPHHGVSLTISAMLDHAVRMGHGGAFVVVPDVSAAPVDLSKFRIDPFAPASCCSNRRVLYGLI